MPIKFECPICSNRLSAKDDYAGKEGKCKCGTALIVPGKTEKMKFGCKHCRKGISVSNRHAGKKTRCPVCKGVITIPLLGKLTEPVSPIRLEEPAISAGARGVAIPCTMCNTSVRTQHNQPGDIIECPECGSFLEVPGAQTVPNLSDIPTADVNPNLSHSESQQTSAPASGKVRCLSCERKLADDAPVCTRCGIFAKSGRPILTAWDMDTDEMEEKAEGTVRAVSWVIPFGLYPVYSEAMGNHKPYATWGIAIITVLISIWFYALDLSGSKQMMSAKNLMLWSQESVPDAERIHLFYEYTSYGDADAFIAKREELSETLPEDEVDFAALDALTPEQRCFGEFRIYQLLTCALLHGGPMHLAGNMLFLLVFGSRVNAAIGNILTVILYPILAVAAAVLYLLAMGPEPPAPMLGASGAVMGLAGAYLLLYPIHKVYMVIWMRWGLIARFHLSYKCFALRGFWVVMFYIMFDIIAVSFVLQTGTAHWAHIGGFITGMLLAFGLLAGRIAYSRSDMLSLILGKYAWGIIGIPANRLK
ncbi:MAG: rhomboid family intramembrane serine protease [Planctomycetota bacterium]